MHTLPREERYYICQAVKSGTSLRAIAKAIGRSVSTVSRELARNTGRVATATGRHTSAVRKGRPLKGRSALALRYGRMLNSVCTRTSVRSKSLEFSNAKVLPSVMNGFTSTFWRTKNEEERCTAICAAQRKRKRRYGKPDRRGQIKGRISIDIRPSIVAERSRLGDWEADTVEGSKGGPVLVTLAERKSRLFLFGKAPNKSASEVRRVIEGLLTPIKDFVQTITYDNGKEFSYHADVSATLEAQGFFAHPYHSWERGLNENSNGLLRQYFPKGVSLASVTQDEIIAAMCRLNWRPRKCLGFKTPYEVFLEDANTQGLGVAL